MGLFPYRSILSFFRRRSGRHDPVKRRLAGRKIYQDAFYFRIIGIQLLNAHELIHRFLLLALPVVDEPEEIAGVGVIFICGHGALKFRARAAKIVLYPVGFFTAWAVFFFWKHASAAIYALLAFLLNALMDSGLEFPALYKLAVYAQTPVIALQIVSLFLPRIPYFGILALLVVGVYLWQAIRLIATPPDPASPLPLDA